MSHSSIVIMLLCACPCLIGACSASERAPGSSDKPRVAATPTKAEVASKPAQDPAPTAAPTAAPAARGPALRSGYVTYRDPATGRLGLPASSITIPSNPSNYSVAGLTPAQQATGGAVVNLQGRFRSQMTAVIGADGKLGIQCEGDRHEHAKGESDAL